MPHLRSFSGFLIHLECWNTFYKYKNKFWEKSLKKNWDIKFVYSEDALGHVVKTSCRRVESTSQGRPLNLRLGCPGRHFRTSLGRQIRTSPGWSNWIFMGRPGDVGGGHSRDVLGTNVFRLGSFSHLKQTFSKKSSTF